MAKIASPECKFLAHLTQLSFCGSYFCHESTHLTPYHLAPRSWLLPTLLANGINVVMKAKPMNMQCTNAASSPSTPFGGMGDTCF